MHVFLSCDFCYSGRAYVEADMNFDELGPCGVLAPLPEGWDFDFEGEDGKTRLRCPNPNHDLRV